MREARADFPILHQQVNGYPLVYVDNAATTQKPQAVITAISDYYRHNNANVHRGVHALSVRATEQFEAARNAVARFIGATSPCECIFVRGATEAINLVAHSYARVRLGAGDEILVTQMEHHANIVPWQMVCQQTGAILKVAPISTAGVIDIDAFTALLSSRTKLVAIGHVSNALGTINPVKQLIALAHAVGAVVLVDGAQAVGHLPVDVRDLDCDFYVFSGHKMYAPTGIGVLWGREALLDSMPPYQGGGEMIHYVTFDHTEYAPLPNKFEAGTPHIAGAIGLHAAIDYLTACSFACIVPYEERLLAYATDAIAQIPGFRIVGTAADKIAILSLVHESVHAHDIGTIMDSRGVALRSGHHCAMPLMDFLNVPATARISLSFYNTLDDIDRCVDTLRYVNEVFKV
jgi:cysteine desulfurase/selenocysteine lyase